MTDYMFIRDLMIRCIIGTRPVERRRRQTVILNIAMACDLARAGRTDNLADTVNYKDLYDRIRALARDSRFLLIERLAAAVADVCLSDRRVKSATVTVDKPRALPGAASAAVSITRRRGTRAAER
jgi:dihydroneopterin aldolase/D-erythro-7,8-dihydroneopterin triphosphate epimerase